MPATWGQVHEYARVTLAGIRLVNGIAALFAPTWVARRLGVHPRTNPAVLYVLRLFGVRTIIIGVDLLLPNEGVRKHALRTAVPIHASDAMAAGMAWLGGQLPPSAGMTTTIISTVNTILAIVAQPPGNLRLIAPPVHKYRAAEGEPWRELAGSFGS